MPGVFKTLTQDDAVAAMQDLLSGGIPPRPADISMRDWTFCARGRPLLTSLKSAGPADAGKLAKAACLNTLVQICDQLEPPGSAAKNSPLQKARRRLQERITASLSGSMVAPQAGPAGTSQAQRIE